MAIFVALLLPVTFTACDTVPEEAVTLADTVGRDLEEVHRAHRELANLLYQRLEADIDRFIDDEYRPAYLQSFLRNKDLDLIGSFQSSLTNESLNQDPGGPIYILSSVLQGANQDIEAKRRDLLAPIQAEHVHVIEEIDAAHRQIQQGHDVVVSHLRSVRDVRDTQNELLSKVGLGDLRQRVAHRTSTLSSKIGELVVRARKSEELVDDAGERIAKLDKMLDELKVHLSSTRIGE
ncbi:MAG: hypothetical protein DHS20C03_35570 [Minwuia thermotolerans]|nr:MAG: hypothetical protein DHS20C03_35570 [Minwuia thermotolerans]